MQARRGAKAIQLPKALTETIGDVLNQNKKQMLGKMRMLFSALAPTQTNTAPGTDHKNETANPKRRAAPLLAADVYFGNHGGIGECLQNSIRGYRSA